MMPAKFTHLDLFAGIGLGGFSRAVHWLGGTTVGFVEWDAWNRRVLAKHWPEARFHGDIKTFTAATLRDWGIALGGRSVAHAARVDDREQPDNGISVAPERDARLERRGGYRGRGEREPGTQLDLITGGYPCQPFSLAGQRLGAEDDRHLWPEMRRVIDLCRPRFVLAENVSGHVSMGLDTVLAELEADGYACGAVVIPACAVNALHRRDRVWIMAHRNGGGTPERGQRADAAGEGGGGRDQPRGRHGDARQVAIRGAGEDPGRMAHAESGPRVPATHGGASGEGGAARLETAGGGGGFAGPGTDPILADASQRGCNGREDQQEQGPAERGWTGIDGQGVGHANGTGPQGWRQRVDGAGERAAGAPGGESLPESRQAPWPVDPRVDGIHPGLVRRSAARSPWDDPDLIRSMWADGSWEHDLPRVVAEEPERRQKLQAAGNAIVPIVAYEILRVMLGEAA